MTQKTTQFSIALPTDLRLIKADDPEAGTLAEAGDRLVADEATNLVFYGGFLMRNAKVTEFDDGNKGVTLQVGNNRPQKNFTGGVKIRMSNQYLKIRGREMVALVEGLGKGSVIACSGHINVDVTNRGTPEQKYLHNIWVTDIKVLTARPFSDEEADESRKRSRPGRPIGRPVGKTAEQLAEELAGAGGVHAEAELVGEKK
jgi:hypothetical protein